MFENLEREDVVRAVDRKVEALLQSAAIGGPPVDAIGLAQGTLGLAIYLDRKLPGRGRIGQAAGKRQIYLRPEPTEERHQWTVAHEIGEHVKSELLEALGHRPGEPRPMTGESLANLFAVRLLVPERWFAADVHDLAFDLAQLKPRYRTASHEVIAWRFLDLPEASIVTIVDNGALHRRRSNHWPTRKKLEPVEARCQRWVHEHGEPTVLRADGWTVQGWPVHKREWKREILRSRRDE